MNIQPSQLLGSTQVSDRTAQLQADVQQGQARTNQLPAFDFSGPQTREEQIQANNSPMFPGGFWNNVKGGAGIVTQGIGNLINGQPFLQTTPMGNIVNPAGPQQQNTPTSQTNPPVQSNPIKTSNPSNPTSNQQGTGVNTSGQNLTAGQQNVYNPKTGMYDSGSNIQGQTAQETNYNIPTNQTTSAAFQTGSTYQDLLAKRQQYENLAQQALQQQLQTQYQGMGNVLEAKYSGDTTDYGIGAGFLEQQRADIQNLKATIPMQMATQGLGFAQQGLQNSLATQPTNADIYTDPQGNRFLLQRDPTTGFNKQIYQGNIYSGIGPNGQPMVPSNSGNQMNQQGQQNQQSQQGQGNQNTYGSNGYGNVDAIVNPIVKSGVVSSPMGSAGNINFLQLDKLPSYIQDEARREATAAGIPALDATGKTAVFAAQQILDVVDAAKALSIRNLSSGTGGHISDSLVNWANNFLQFNPDLSNFDQLRDAASKATTALAGGNGSGFRMNMGIIEAAIQNLPRASDSLETALTRADALGTQIINGLKPVFPNVTSGQYGNLLQSQYTGSGSNTSSQFAGDAWK